MKREAAAIVVCAVAAFAGPALDVSAQSTDIRDILAAKPRSTDRRCSGMWVEGSKGRECLGTAVPSAPVAVAPRPEPSRPLPNTDVPTFDVNALCGEYGRKNGPDALRGCLSKEQREYDALRYLWPSASVGTKSLCLHNLRTVKGDFAFNYTLLSECAAALASRDALDRQGPFKP